MADILTSINTRMTPQRQKARADQVTNAAGGYVFQVGDEARLRRFLTLGTEGGTYYVSAKELTRENAAVVFRMAASQPDVLISEIVVVSTAGRAPKNKYALFALAIAASAENVETRRKALAVLHQVCRTGTHLFEFNTYVEQFRGRGRALNRAVANWYLEKPVDKLAYQAVKYRQRAGWTHRDLLRLVKPGQFGPKSPERDALLAWITTGVAPERGIAELAIVEDFLELQSLQTVPEWVTVINRDHGISWEMLPDAALKSPAVWEALLTQGVPQTALMRQLPRLTNLGLTTGATGQLIARQLVDEARLKNGRVHPINVLVAQRTYAQGRGERGHQTWSPTPAIIDALHDAFYAAYGAVEPANKRTLVASDVSGSMTWSQINGLPLMPLEVCGALALVMANTEPDVIQLGFTTRANPLTISKRQRLDDVLHYMRRQPNGGTDVSLPMTWAFSNRVEVDTFLVLSDNETWAGRIHPHQALQAYRDRMGINARMVVVAMTPSGHTVTVPEDPDSLDIAGFDTSVPQLISDFSAGRL